MPEYTRDPLPYNPYSIVSITSYAKDLVGHSLREKTDVEELQDPHKRRGSFGNAVEEYYFFYKPNSSPEADFPGVGLELKTTPAKRSKNGELHAKERLVLSQIDFMTVAEETWNDNTLSKKLSDILLIVYIYDADQSPVDYEVAFADVWSVPPEDEPIFQHDWETIVGKVRAGKAHEISGSDTLYLEACTKAKDSTVRRRQPYSDIPAKPRAWAIKASYVTDVIMRHANEQAIARSEEERDLGLLELLHSRFKPFFGKTEDELLAEFGYVRLGQRKPKSACALVTKAILGIEKGNSIAEFERAGIKPKTMRVKANGMLKESVSFPCFDYFDLAKRPFEDSDFLGYLESKYLFVIYREDGRGTGRYVLSDLALWQMPESDLPEARKCYEQMQENVLMGRADVSVKSTENRCCHVRPHGQSAADTLPTPYGKPEVKKCFWLNARYVSQELVRVLGE